jgi:hypothetical protein
MEIVLIFLLFISGIAVIVLTRNIYLAIVSCRWQVVQATVIGVGSEKTSDSDFYPRYIPQIRYTYSINGVVYHKERYEFVKKLYTKKELDSILNGFTIGEIKDIRINSRNPKQSVIVPGADLVHFILLAGSLFLFCSCVLTFF